VPASNGNANSAFANNNRYINVHAFANGDRFTDDDGVADADRYRADDHRDTVGHTNRYTNANGYTADTDGD
jgi:hypothetical protein